MTKLFRKHRLLLLSLVMVVALTACRSVLDQNGSVKPEYILSLNTSFGQAWNDGFFTAIFVYPISLLLNYLAHFDFIGAGGSVIIVTLLFNAFLTPMMINQQLMTQKTQLIAPETQRINAKYQGKTDQQSQIRKSQELQALYKKHNINPLAALIPLLIQLPLLFAMFGAVQRSESIINGTFFGISLSTTVNAGASQSWIFLAVYAVNVLASFVAFYLPQQLVKQRKKQAGIKEKAYARDKNQPNPESTNTTMFIVSVGMTAVFGWLWPVGMSLYWATGSIARILQSLYIHFFVDMTK